jgi:hypothetical protein
MFYIFVVGENYKNGGEVMDMERIWTGLFDSLKLHSKKLKFAKLLLSSNNCCKIGIMTMVAWPLK